MSVMGRSGGVSAVRSGIMKQGEAPGLASASSRAGKGRRRRKRMVASVGASSSATARISTWPKPSRTAQRRMEATQSRPRTGSLVVEAQALAQGDGPGEAVGAHLVAARHLRAGAQGAVGAVERVEDAVAVGGDDGGGARDRVQHRERRLRHEAQGAGAGGLGPCLDPCLGHGRSYGGRGEGGGQQ
jgi:hypothetical protein